MKNSSIIFFILLLLHFGGCKKDNPNSSVEKGFVQGTVHALKADKIISGANVYARVNGTTYQTRSNTSGYFKLELPIGHHNLIMETGNGKLFKTVTEVHVEANETLDLPLNETQLKQAGQLAYVFGEYDYIQQIIMDSLGYSITQIHPNQLNALNNFSQYDAVFINCGAPDLTDTAAYSNLSQFVTNGGSLYVSDYAVSYLTGIHNGSCNRPLGFIDDNLLCSFKAGSVVTHTAAIVDTSFQSFMGKTSMTIYYDLPDWEVITNHSAAYWETIVQLPGAFPLMLRKSNYTNGSSSGNNGNIYFTNFHNQPNGLINQDMQHMLEFVILNL